MSENKSAGNNPDYQAVRQEFFASCERQDSGMSLSNPTPSVERQPEVLLNVLESMESMGFSRNHSK